MGKSTTPSFVVSLRLLTTKEDEQELENHMGVQKEANPNLKRLKMR